MILSFYLLFHLKSFFGLRELIILFISNSVIGIMFIVGKFLGNESFMDEIASLFSGLYMFNFSVVVKKKVIEGT